MRKVVLAALYLPPGMTIDQYFLPPYSADEIVRRAIFQSQVVVGDIIMVCLCFLITRPRSPSATGVSYVSYLWEESSSLCHPFNNDRGVAR